MQGIADGDVATGVKGFDPIANNQLTQDEIETAEKNPLHKLKLKYNPAAQGEEKRRGPRYTPPGFGRQPDLKTRGDDLAHNHNDPRADPLEHLQHAAH